ncbi:hypothetical protein GOV13_03205 [Candidatus Pacearchaeota archaeon]|nr:hypothetical protein [Candidatus Pacearchaeota archaeon]
MEENNKGNYGAWALITTFLLVLGGFYGLGSYINSRKMVEYNQRHCYLEAKTETERVWDICDAKMEGTQIIVGHTNQNPEKIYTFDTILDKNLSKNDEFLNIKKSTPIDIRDDCEEDGRAEGVKEAKPIKALLRDVNKDGRKDLVLYNIQGGEIEVLLSKTNGYYANEETLSKLRNKKKSIGNWSRFSPWNNLSTN